MWLRLAKVAVVFAGASADPWMKWHKQMVIDGQGHDGKAEKQGVLEYLDVDGKAVMRLELHDVGIRNLTNERHEAGQPDKMRAEMYVGSAVLSFPRQ